MQIGSLGGHDSPLALTNEQSTDLIMPDFLGIESIDRGAGGEAESYLVSRHL